MGYSVCDLLWWLPALPLTLAAVWQSNGSKQHRPTVSTNRSKAEFQFWQISKPNWESFEEDIPVNMKPMTREAEESYQGFPYSQIKELGAAATEPKLLLHRSQLVRISRHDLISHPV